MYSGDHCGLGQRMNHRCMKVRKILDATLLITDNMTWENFQMCFLLWNTGCRMSSRLEESVFSSSIQDWSVFYSTRSRRLATGRRRGHGPANRFEIE
jgi:hypothetical protein